MVDDDHEQDPKAMTARGSLLVFACVALAVAHGLAFAGYLVDDAYISFRYADMLARGHGLVFNLGERVEGYTNFAWVVLCALGEALGLRSPLLAPVLGLALHGGLTALCYAAAARRAPGLPGAGWVAAVIVALSTGLAFYAVSGLEGALYTVLLTAAALALLESRYVRFAWLASLAFLTRPEAGLLIAFGLAWLGVAARTGRVARGTAVKAAACCALLLLPYLAFKLAYFGALVPNTFHAKSPDAVAGAGYVAAHVWPALGLFAVALHGARTRLEHGALALWLAYVLSVIVTGGDWMPAGRLLVPYLPLLAIVASRPIAAALRDRRWLRAALPLLLFAAPQIASTQALARSARHTLELDEVRARVYRDIAGTGARSIAAHDIGLLGYLLPDVRIVDLGGLTDRRIARAPGGYGTKHPPLDHLETLAPEWVLIASRPPTGGALGPQLIPLFEVERYLLASEWLQRGYRYHSSHAISASYHVHLFMRLAR